MARIAVFSGDGIGPEVIQESLKVLRVAANRFAVSIELHEAPDGDGAYEATGSPLPDATLALCQQADAILSAAMLLEYALQAQAAVAAVEMAVIRVLDRGCRTPDIAQPGTHVIGTREMGDHIAEALSAGPGP
jgi:isocitrate/isopropylmalate dehydrogenase